MNLTIAFWILAFACTVALNCQNTSQNACHGCEKHKKNEPNPKKIMTDENLRGSVNVIDITLT